MDITKINWKLLPGSHEFPGPDGGTCITEAAIVAAGFKYRRIRSVENLPPCFSPEIATFAARLNDEMPDDLRQKFLMPFVVRLVGTKDTKAVEMERASFMALETFRRIMSSFCVEVLGAPSEFASIVGSVFSIGMVCKDLRAVEGPVFRAFGLTEKALGVTDVLRHMSDDACWMPPGAAEATRVACGVVKLIGRFAPPEWKAIYFPVAARILDEAILLGNHPTIEDVELVKERFEQYKASA